MRYTKKTVVSATLYYGIFHWERIQIVCLIQCLADSKESINVYFNPFLLVKKTQNFSEISFNYHNISQTSISSFILAKSLVQYMVECLLHFCVINVQFDSEKKSFSKCSENSLCPCGLSLLI